MYACVFLFVNKSEWGNEWSKWGRNPTDIIYYTFRDGFRIDLVSYLSPKNLGIKAEKFHRHINVRYYFQELEFMIKAFNA